MRQLVVIEVAGRSRNLRHDPDHVPKRLDKLMHAGDGDCAQGGAMIRRKQRDDFPPLLLPADKRVLAGKLQAAFDTLRAAGDKENAIKALGH